jgi:acetyl esterase/lipase
MTGRWLRHLLPGLAVVALLLAGCLPASGTTPTAAPGQAASSTSQQIGYWEVASDGGIFTFGDAQFYGSMGGHPLNAPVVGMASTPGGGGYWEVASDGGIFSFGDAQFYGSMGGHPLNAPVIGMISSPDGRGYTEFASDGGIFTFGDAQFYGSTGGSRIPSPIVGVAPSAGDHGYWEVAANGTVYGFGSAVGSIWGQSYPSPNDFGSPVVGIASPPDGWGYWVVTASGAVYGFGSAATFGSLTAGQFNGSVSGIVGTPDGMGYWITTSTGFVYPFGDAVQLGSMGGHPLNRPVVGVAAVEPAAPVTVSYGPSQLQRAHVYPSPHPGSPVVVLVHGGGYDGGSWADPGVPGEAIWLQSQGFTVYVADYQFPNATRTAFPIEVNDVVEATRYAEATAALYNGDPSNVSLFGGSAGGTLVALAVNEIQVAHVVDLSGPTDFVTYFQGVDNHTIPGWQLLVAPIEAAFGCAPLSSCSTSFLEQWSPAYHADKAASWFIGNSSNDPLVPSDQSALLAWMAGDTAAYHQVAGSQHAFEMDPVLNAAIVSFLRGRTGDG